MIFSGELPPGRHVSEAALAEEIGVSRMPVRDAIRRLEVEGLLESVPRFGTVVKAPSRQDVVELYELREALETYAVTKATEHATADEIERLERHCAALQAAADRLRASGESVLDDRAYRQSIAEDLRFHLVILEAACNQRLLQVALSSQMLTRLFSLPRPPYTPSFVSQIHAHHAEVLAAMRKGDKEAARTALAAHIRLSRDMLLTLFDRDPERHDDAPPARARLAAHLQAELQRIEEPSPPVPDGNPPVKE
jgi:DNA-binding GntR family transcriptional regulator